MKLRSIALAAIAAVSFGAQATIINFDGGTNANSTTYQESGIKVQIIGGDSYFGDYYGTGNKVMHAHWATGGYGSVTKIIVSKIDGTAFDLNYFVLTSDTDVGGGVASGSELAYIHASSSADGSTSDYAQQLPSEDWGFPATQVFLGAQFDGIKSFWFDVANDVACFGMDSFYIDEVAPPNPNAVPEPTTLALGALGFLALATSPRKIVRG